MVMGIVRRTIYIKILLVWYIKEYIGIVMQVHINFTFSYFPFYYTCGRFLFSFLLHYTLLYRAVVSFSNAGALVDTPGRYATKTKKKLDT